MVFELLRGLDRVRYAPQLLVASERGGYLSELPGDVPVHFVRGRYPIVQSVRAIRRARPDVVIAMQRMVLTLGAARRALPARTRVILRQANDMTADMRQLAATSVLKHRIAHELALSALARADAVICQSASMQRDLRAQLRRTDHLHVIANPIDVEAAARVASAPASLPGAPALVSVGRLSTQKGYDLLLPAISRVRSRFPALHLTVFGDGPDRAKLEGDLERLGLRSHVTLAGFQASVLPYVRAADAFVLASRYEGLPNAALEALACGTPVVLTDCPGANSELVVEGRNGRLAARPDPVAIASALDACLVELTTYDRSWIRADCERRFSAARIIGEYERLITSLVGRTTWKGAQECSER